MAFSMPAVPTPSERALRLECSTASISQADIHDCLNEKMKESLEALRKAEKLAVAALSKWAHDKQFIIQAKQNLAVSNKEFIKYRDIHCKFMTSLGASAIGAALDLRRFACIAELNYNRAEQLRDAMLDVHSTFD
jgi:hypothetical protein